MKKKGPDNLQENKLPDNRTLNAVGRYKALWYS